MNNPVPPNKRILRRHQMTELTGLAISTIYDKLDPRSPRHDKKFPKPIKLGPKAVGWLASDLEVWIESRILAAQEKNVDR